MQAIQSLLTIAIEATAIIGFCGIVAKAIWLENQRWMKTYCPPVKPYSQAVAEVEPQAISFATAQGAIALNTKQEEAIDADEPSNNDPWELEIDEQIQQPKRLTVRHFSQQLALPPAREAAKPQQPTFNGYSQSRLRKIAKELKIKRYSVMSTQELMSAIAKHPKAQEALTA